MSDFKIHTQLLLNKISSGVFDDSHLADLMLQVRQFRGIDKVTLDLCNFVTHNKGRNQGQSFEIVKKMIDDFIIAIVEKGTTNFPPPLFVKNDILKKLYRLIRSNGFTMKSVDFENQRDKFYELLVSRCHKVNYDITHPNIERCWVEKENDKGYIFFVLKNLPEHAVFADGGTKEIAVLLFTIQVEPVKPISITFR